MAKLFNKQILTRHIQKHSIADEKDKIQRIARWKRNLKLNRNVNEEELQAAFLKGIFGSILGYRDLTEAENKQYTMKVEPATEVDASKPDGSLGFFEINGAEQTKVVIELKGPKISLDKKQKRSGKDYGTPVEQAFGYATKYDGCEWVLVSNMIEIRLYKYARGQGHYEEFLIPRLDDPANFKQFHLILSRPNLINRENGSLTERLTRETLELEEDITNKFYNLYKQTRIDLFEHLKEHNPDYDQELLFEKAQKFLDRIIFICFCEDLGLLPPKILHKAIQSGKDSFSMSETRIWDEIKGIFKAIDEGNPDKNINAYNGGLFKPDPTLHQLTIKNEFFPAIDEISAYDFDSDLDVNILGHIFEQSISDIEEIKADIQAEEYNQQESKRKKEGIFYTPEYITKYIVENSVGKYVEDIKEELGFEQLPDINSADSPQIQGKYKKMHLKFYNKYARRLRNIKILDPACGSGAFLNQAFDYLLKEYKWIRNQRSLLEDNAMRIDLQDKVLKHILQDNLYGVDLNQESVEITKLSLWLKSANKNKPLANLDDNIKCGNSLIDDPKVAGDKAFDWEKEFPEIMKNGGFDVVIGNPPYVRYQKIKNIKNYLSENYIVYKGTADLYCYFFEKSIFLLKPKGYFAFITSNKFTRASYGRKLRKLLLNYTIDEFIDYSGEKVFSQANVDPCIIIIKKTPNPQNDIKYNKSKKVSQNNLSKEKWVFTGNREYLLKDKILDRGIALDKWPTKINFGIVTGFNKAFIINNQIREEIISEDKRNQEIIKPILRGKDIQRYKIQYQNLYLLATGYDINIPNKYPAVYKYLEKYKEKASERGAKGKNWWNLRACSYYDDLKNEKIIWPDIADKPKFFLDESNYFVTNSVYLLTGNNLKYLTGLLNSKLITYTFKKFISGGKLGKAGIRYQKEFLNKLPIYKPRIDERNYISNKVKLVLDYNNKTCKLNNRNFSFLINKFCFESGPTLSTITTQSQFFNQIYTGRARKVRPLTVNINDNILTVYTEKSGSGLYELFKFQVDDDYQRRYIQLYLENLTEEKLEEVNNYSGNLPEKVLKIEIPDYNKSNVVQKVVDEWQSLQDEIESLESKIEQTDREIDEMVYELYGLTDEEIEIVEGSV